MHPFDLNRISASLASASINPEHWPQALDIAASCTGSHGAIVLPVVGALPMMWNTPSMDESAQRYVEGEWYNRDDRYLGVPTFLKTGVATDDDCLPIDIRRKSPFYQDFLAACGLCEFAGVRVGRGDHVWNLSLQRSVGQDPYSLSERSALAVLSNQLDSVVEVSRALSLARGNAALDAFQFSDQAALLLDRDGSVMRANGAAEALLGSDLQISGGRLVAAAPQSAERLGALFKQLFWQLTGALLPPLVLRKRDGGRFVIYAMRIPGATASPLTEFCAILVISDSARVLAPLAATLRLAFDLTPAEARLAVALRNGIDLATYAAGAGISKETVRNQLKSVFEKVGVKRQAELASVLSTLLNSR